MVLSMTGYGFAKRESSLFQVSVEIKSVNHRFAETNIRIPRQFLIFEEKIKKILANYVHRGRLEVFITVDGEGLVERCIQVDWQLMDEVYQALKTAKEKYLLQDDISLQDLFRNEEIMSVVEKRSDHDGLEELLMDAVKIAAEQLKKMRLQEGSELKTAILTYLQQIKESAEELRQLAPQMVEQYRQKIMKRIDEYVSGSVDESRILTEVAIFADKADITEEITRINSHVTQFTETLHHGESIGRKLDFLVQELNREINTIGSKANDSVITQKVVDMKSDLEKIREQVQNIE